MAGRTARRIHWRRVDHPAFALALVVLVVNDQLLKQAWPGPLTGKLSDVAGLFLLGSLAFDGLDRFERDGRWRAVVVGAIALAFVTVKTNAGATGVARELAASVLDVVGAVLGWLPFVPADGNGAHIVTDPSDVIALPALVLPLWIASADAADRRSRRAARHRSQVVPRS